MTVIRFRRVVRIQIQARDRRGMVGFDTDMCDDTRAIGTGKRRTIHARAGRRLLRIGLFRVMVCGAGCQRQSQQGHGGSFEEIRY